MREWRKALNDNKRCTKPRQTSERTNLEAVCVCRYPGTVVSKQGATLRIRFDDGDVMTAASAADLRLLRPFGVGTRLQALLVRVDPAGA